MLQHLASNWFLLFYTVLALLMMVQGIIWTYNPRPFFHYLSNSASAERRPPLLLKSARYLVLFSTMSLIFAFILRSIIDIVFCLGLVSISFTLLNHLTRWPQLRHAIPEHPGTIIRFLRYMGIFSMSTALVLALLVYRHVAM